MRIAFFLSELRERFRYLIGVLKNWRYSSKSLQDYIAKNIYNIFTLFMTIGILICFLGLAGIWSASSRSDITQVSLLSFYALIFLYIPNVVINFYRAYKIIPNLKEHEPIAQCAILRIGLKPFGVAIFGLIFVLACLLFIQYYQKLGLKDFGGDVFAYGVFHSLTLIAFSLTLSSNPFLITSHKISRRETLRISLDLIQNFDGIVKQIKNKLAIAGIWNLLFKNAIQESEFVVKQLTGVSRVDFLKPFNAVCLAAGIGNKEEKEKAKNWIRDLALIVADEELKGENKAKHILEHIDKTQIEFSRFLKLNEQYNLGYSIKPLRRRDVMLGVTFLGTTVKTIVTFVTFIGLLYLIIQQFI